MTNRANQNGPGDEVVEIVSETRHKTWHDRNFAEQWDFRGLQVLRHRALASYPWEYKIGRFTSDHCPYAESQHRAMTQEEISAFKLARSA
jgi:hypothetical protein